MVGFTSESDFWTPGGVLRVDTESVGGLRAFVAALVSRVAAILSAPALVAARLRVLSVPKPRSMFH